MSICSFSDTIHHLSTAMTENDGNGNVYCQQCTEEVYDGDHRVSDFKHMLPRSKAELGFKLRVSCDGCGGKYVDREGKCVDYDCDEHGSC